MPLFPPRRMTAIDAELRSLRDVMRGASGELTEVRRRQAELFDMEAALLVAIDVRMRRLDDLLDQRLHVVRDGKRASGTAHQAEAGLRSADRSGGEAMPVSGPTSSTR